MIAALILQVVQDKVDQSPHQLRVLLNAKTKNWQCIVWDKYTQDPTKVKFSTKQPTKPSAQDLGAYKACAEAQNQASAPRNQLWPYPAASPMTTRAATTGMPVRHQAHPAGAAAGAAAASVYAASRVGLQGEACGFEAGARHRIPGATCAPVPGRLQVGPGGSKAGAQHSAPATVRMPTRGSAAGMSAHASLGPGPSGAAARAPAAPVDLEEGAIDAGLWLSEFAAAAGPAADAPQARQLLHGAVEADRLPAMMGALLGLRCLVG